MIPINSRAFTLELWAEGVTIFWKSSKLFEQYYEVVSEEQLLLLIADHINLYTYGI